MCINVTVTSADLINFYSDMVWRQEGIQMSSVSDDKVTNEWVKKAIDLLQQYHGKLVATSCPAILCSALPTHHRSNKSLRNPFKVIVMDEVADGTTVTVKAGNDENPCAEIKNCTAVIKDQVAVFNDIRFIGRSGRGKTFNVSIIVNSNPVQIGTYNKAIKVTVDGPREPRSKNSFAYYPGQHPLLFNAYPMSHVAWLDPAYMNALSAEYLSNHLMAFSNQQSTSAPQFGFHNGYSQYTTAVFPGKSFNLTIIIGTNPPEIATYMKAIKVTVDGPREARSKMKHHAYPVITNHIDSNKKIKTEPVIPDNTSPTLHTNLKYVNSNLQDENLNTTLYNTPWNGYNNYYLPCQNFSPYQNSDVTSITSDYVPSHTTLQDHQLGENSNPYFRTNSPEEMNTMYTCNTLPNISNSHSHQYQHNSVGHPHYETSPYPTSVTGTSNLVYWSGSNTNNTQSPQANNFYHQNCYSNHYGVKIPSGPITPAPVQNNPHLNSAPPPVVLYSPSYSQVNQNQIHLHLHPTEFNKPVEQYLENVAPVVGRNNLTITGNSRSIEIAPPNEATVEEQSDTVWRPY